MRRDAMNVVSLSAPLITAPPNLIIARPDTVPIKVESLPVVEDRYELVSDGRCSRKRRFERPEDPRVTRSLASCCCTEDGS